MDIKKSIHNILSEAEKAFRPDKNAPKTPNDICPVCGQTKFEDISPRENNGIFGSGFASSKLVDLKKCTSCNVVISP